MADRGRYNMELHHSDYEAKLSAQSSANRGRGHETTREYNGLGVCGVILMVVSFFIVLVFFPFSMLCTLKVVSQYQRGVIFRMGRVRSGRATGPGLVFLFPFVDELTIVDMRTYCYNIPPQEILTKDSVTVKVDAVIYMCIYDAMASVNNVKDSSAATQLLGATTLRNIMGTRTLAEVLSDRDSISRAMQSVLDESTHPWGLRVERVEVKDVELPKKMQRVMAAEAESSREARAKVIAADGEVKASRSLKEAADIISQSPCALQLRYLQTLGHIAAENHSTILFPLPVDTLSTFLKK